MTTDVSKLREIAIEQVDLLSESGFNKPLTKIELSDKVNIIQTVTLHKVVLGSLAELSQFRAGLSALGVLDAIKEHSHLLASYYCCDCDETSTGMLFRTTLRFLCR